MKRHFLEIENLSRRFPTKGGELTVFENASFTIDKGEFVCIIGHSGCGKSTIMNVLAGLDAPTDGNVFMDGVEVSGPSLDRGVVFQNYSLLPWLSALSNVSFAVRSRWPGWSNEQVREHSYKYLEMVGLGGGAELRKPAQLSGGMRQRVSIARAFAIQPKLLLLDEPFGALDALTRERMNLELLRIWGESRKTILFVTHSIQEAVLMGSHCAVLTAGPARMADYFAIDLPYPRRLDMRQSADFGRHARRIYDLLGVD
jgi:nitrate/nitrite transport system ATP-binding protein